MYQFDSKDHVYPRYLKKNVSQNLAGPLCLFGSHGPAHILEKEEIYPDEDGSALIFVMWLLKHQVPL